MRSGSCTQCGMSSQHSSFYGGETEAQRSPVTSRRLHGQKAVELGGRPTCLWFQTPDSVRHPAPSKPWQGQAPCNRPWPGPAASFPSMPLESPCRSQARSVLPPRSALVASVDVTLGPPPGTPSLLSPHRPGSLAKSIFLPVFPSNLRGVTWPLSAPSAQASTWLQTSVQSFRVNEGRSK